MQFVELGSINPLAVLVATLLSFLLGFLWYGFLFCKPWMTAMGLKSEDIESSGLSMKKAVIGSTAASFATALGIALLMVLLKNSLASTIFATAVLVWFAFSLGPMFKLIFWEDRPFTLFLIDGGYELVSILVVTTILFLWR